MGLGLLWAILLAVASNIVLGMIWYGPLFGKLWARSIGLGELTKEQEKEMGKEAMPGYLFSMVGAAAATSLLWFLFDWADGAPEGYNAALKGIVLGLTGFVAFYVLPTFTARFFEKQNLTTWALGAGYWGILACLYGLYVGLFQ